MRIIDTALEWLRSKRLAPLPAQSLRQPEIPDMDFELDFSLPAPMPFGLDARDIENRAQQLIEGAQVAALCRCARAARLVA